MQLYSFYHYLHNFLYGGGCSLMSLLRFSPLFLSFSLVSKGLLQFCISHLLVKSCASAPSSVSFLPFTVGCVSSLYVAITLQGIYIFGSTFSQGLAAWNSLSDHFREGSVLDMQSSRLPGISVIFSYKLGFLGVAPWVGAAYCSVSIFSEVVLCQWSFCRVGGSVLVWECFEVCPNPALITPQWCSLSTPRLTGIPGGRFLGSFSGSLELPGALLFYLHRGATSLL